MQLQNSITLKDSHLPTNLSDRVLSLCAEAKEKADAGEFEAARALLSDLWERVGDRPRIEELDNIARAEVLLRVGSLSGWIGSSRQIPGAQEIAKDLLTESAALFEEIGLVERVVEARIDLGICYWREGSVDEARITLDDALMRLGGLDSEQKLRAILNKAIVEEVSNRPKAAFQLLQESAPMFEANGSHSLRGKFHNELATVLKNLGLADRREDYIDRALVEYAAASFHFEEAGHRRFQGVVENNLGFLYVHLTRFEDAHEHLSRARLVALSLKDAGLVAQFDDTRARAFLAQGQLKDAERTAFGAVRALQQGGQQSILAEALTTHGTALARLERNREALNTLTRAIEVSELGGDPERAAIAALTVVEELKSSLPLPRLRQYYWRAESSLACSQHPGIQLRLGECARRILAAEVQSGNGNGSTLLQLNEPSLTEAISSCSLEDEVLRYEGGLIRRALETSGGSVTRAARLLGITHQGLAFILNGRHKDLLSVRTPIKPRRRSIIRYR